MNTVTWGGWNVSVTTGYGITGAVLGVFRPVVGGRKMTGPITRYKPLKGEGDRRQFESSDAAFAWALEHGYLQPLYRGRWCVKCRTQHQWRGKPSAWPCPRD